MSVVPRDITFLLLDGLKRRPGGRRPDAALCALGLNGEGVPIPLLMRVVPVEEERSWRDVLAELRAAGVGPELLLIVADGHPALLKAVHGAYPDVPLQVCVAHRLLALSRKVNARWRNEVLAGARRIFAAADRAAAVALFREWHASWLRQGEPAVRMLEADLASSLTFYRFPQPLWSKIRTVNLVERAFRLERRAAPPAPFGLLREIPASPPGGPVPDREDAVDERTASPEVAAPPADGEEASVLVIPARSNGHVTPDLIGAIAVAAPAATADAPEVEETLPPFDSLVSEERQEEPASRSAVDFPAEEAPPGPTADAGPADPGDAAPPPQDAPAPEEDTAVWTPPPLEHPGDEIVVFEPHPIDLDSDEEFDQRLSAYGRYVMQLRVAFTLTSAAGLVTGVVLAFIR